MIKLHRRQLLAYLAATPFLASVPMRTAFSAGAVPDTQAITDAYVYLLSRMLVIRQEHHDLKEPGIDYNVIKYNPRGSADFVNPNLDVAYLEAWIGVDDDTPVILDVPEIQGRYTTAQLLDEWGEVIANINERKFPSKPSGRFALVSPGSTAALPADAARIELHSGKAKLLARVELKDDADGAMTLQRQFQLHVQGKPRVTPAVQIPEFNNQDLLGADIFDNVDVVLASALDVSPVAAQMQQSARFVAGYLKSDPQARARVDALLREKVVPGFKEFAFTKSAPYRNHWIGGGQTGNYGSDYRMRSVVNYAGIWGNTTDEVIYFVATRDANEQALDGGSHYVMHFAADQLPDAVVDAYWSVILVSIPEYRVVDNPLHRYNLNNYSALQKEQDGSLKIVIGPSPISGVPESNWLPSKAGQPYSLTFRTYVPKEAVKTGEWAPPAVTMIH